MKAMDHNTGQNFELGTEFALLSIVFMFLQHIGIGDAASFIAIVSGGASLFINWPKIKNRIQEIRLKFKRKKGR